MTNIQCDRGGLELCLDPAFQPSQPFQQPKFQTLPG